MRTANLSPWIDKENILPGKSRKKEVNRAIKESRYFVALLSSRSIGARGEAQAQIKVGLPVQKEFPESQIFFIPARLDEFDISQSESELIDIEYVDLFPIWEEGLTRILKAMNIENLLRG